MEIEKYQFQRTKARQNKEKSVALLTFNLLILQTDV